jgi:hypothetical protein
MTQKTCASCTVRTEFVNVIQLIFVFKGLIRHYIPITFVYKGTSYSTYCVACKPNLNERLYSHTPHTTPMLFTASCGCIYRTEEYRGWK